MLEKTERTIKNGQSRETGNIGYTRRRQTKENTTQYMFDTIIHKQTQTSVYLLVGPIRPWCGLVVLIKLWWTH